MYCTLGGDQSPIFNSSSNNVNTIDEVKPVGDEPIIKKNYPSSFAKTNLHELIQATSRKNIILAGAMTSTCISSTAREAQSLGYRTTVVASACCTRSLPDPIHSGKVIDAEQVHLGALTALSDAVAVITPDTSKLIAQSA